MMTPGYNRGQRFRVVLDLDHLHLNRLDSLSMSDTPIELTLPTESELLRVSGIENFVQSAREYMDPGEGKNDATHVAKIGRAHV